MKYNSEHQATLFRLFQNSNQELIMSLLSRTISDLGKWQKEIVTKQMMQHNKTIRHPAAAPISTDQEAGGASTTPDGKRVYDPPAAESPTIRE
jgi:hypothetical protein